MRACACHFFCCNFGRIGLFAGCILTHKPDFRWDAFCGQWNLVRQPFD